jgi:3-oxoacyl-[acyl-carrier protein] reductase
VAPLREVGGRAGGGRLLVAGATGLVGPAVAAAAAADGTALVLLGRSTRPLAELAGRLTAEYAVPVLPVEADVTDTASLDRAAKHLRDAGIDTLDGLVDLVTGYDGSPAAVDDLAADTFRRVMETDVTGAFQLVRTFLPLLRRASSARIVLTSSVAALRGRPMAAHLCAAKAGVHGLTLALATELAADGIVVNTVAPGPILRPGTGHPPSPVPPTTPEHVARTVLELISPASRAHGRPVVITGDGVDPVPTVAEPASKGKP